MRKILFLSTVLFITITSNSYAYTITAIDDKIFSLKEAKIKNDSNRYRSILEVNEEESIITVIQDTDLNSEKSYKSDRIFKIIVSPESQPIVHKKSLKAMYVNEKTGGIEIISFSEGKFFWVKVHSEYVNMSSGSYISDKKF